MKRWYITIYPNYWGRGITQEESRANARREGGRGSEWATFLLPEFVGDDCAPYVDGMGLITWCWKNFERPPEGAATEELIVKKGKGWTRKER